MDEKIYKDMKRKFDMETLEMAKETLKIWVTFDDKYGQLAEGHPDYKPRKLCERFFSIYKKDGENCAIDLFGDCIFHRCLTRPSYNEWIDHHKKNHKKDGPIYKVKAGCEICQKLHDEETRIMKHRIEEFERRLNETEMPRETDTMHYAPTSPDIESTVRADLDSLHAEEEMFEGKRGQRFTTYYERNPKLRRKAIEIHGFKCMTCGFEFANKYGVRGSEYIEVHHLNPVSLLDEAMPVDPKTEMAVVCSNCHRMIHRKKDNVLSLDELREIVKQNQKGLGE